MHCSLRPGACFCVCADQAPSKKDHATKVEHDRSSRNLASTALVKFNAFEREINGDRLEYSLEAEQVASSELR
eukprot:CAMPEP_0171646144 /NCGR_PEP_ID=MMETSP0990-20121206/34588_1 /TAXON_ID=483369 /ORGANISM="non described non described, Strain CCMP2098" /LENGTH=72 /DNA_ID=CAMNT_0012222925 /DNA_START=403 /DNA_END=621 /DNA_ORIENTATION=+